jgi:uncharacterized membrane-anchored protein YhcB (DUF1043 family)
MQKGQISLDLIITLIVAIIIISVFATLTITMRENQQEINLQNQLRKSGSELSSLITSLQSLSDTNFEFQINFKEISQGYRTDFPRIEIDGNLLIAYHENSDVNFEYSFSGEGIVVEEFEGGIIIENQ